ncbi:sugar phosphate isomerase/epimerase family protein [Domibacillus enclensis]|uniref:AP endonuclease n=1 Tax=Domibacillus enclensis TaxID=1017273 RepID=A0A1N6Z852_9BACI|nr:sugar phosphate isomerase/epimerase family protein [Domibacillus enclensis]OXS76622.1 AP endonuclease [Domibacillus enclensis]SIR23052.1 Sugar phosphate isomerase/epimerase [Domibacillus enclensis]
MILGLRGHDLDQMPADQLAQTIKKKGFNAVQLAVAKSFDFYTGPGSLTMAISREIGEAFRENGVKITVLGCYIHMIHPDPDIRRRELDRFKEHLAAAQAFDCLLVGTETGNVHAEMGYTEDNFKEEPFLAVVDSVKELAAEAEKLNVKIGIEAGVNHPIYSPETMKRMLDLVDSPNVRVIFDPVNLLTPETWSQQQAIYQQAFDLFGDKIDVLHAKDVTLKDGRLQPVPVGSGLIDYEEVFRLLKSTGRQVPVLLEDVRDPHIEKSRTFLVAKITDF